MPSVRALPWPRPPTPPGPRRFWVAEHHNMPAVAATNPPVLIAMIAGATQRIRVGSGGVMLPNHAPLVVAEQFALLEAAYPDRIDLGIGRAPGSDPVTNWALRHGGPETADPQRFDEHVANLLAMLSPEGAALSVQGEVYPLRATPQALRIPDVWLLGSSDFSARLAAERGLPYVFAHHFSGRGTAEALDLYRSTFRASEHLAEPKTFLTVNVAVAETASEAQRLARPQLLAMVALRTRGSVRPDRHGRAGRADRNRGGPPGPGRRDDQPLGDRHTGRGGRATPRAGRHLRGRRGDDQPDRRRVRARAARPGTRPGADRRADGRGPPAYRLSQTIPEAR